MRLTSMASPSYKFRIPSIPFLMLERRPTFRGRFSTHCPLFGGRCMSISFASWNARALLCLDEQKQKQIIIYNFPVENGPKEQPTTCKNCNLLQKLFFLRFPNPRRERSDPGLYFNRFSMDLKRFSMDFFWDWTEFSIFSEPQGSVIPIFGARRQRRQRITNYLRALETMIPARGPQTMFQAI